MSNVAPIPVVQPDNHGQNYPVYARNKVKETTPQSLTTRVVNTFYNLVVYAGYTTDKSELLEKVTKNTHRGLDILLRLETISDVSLTGLSSTLKGAAEIFESLRFVGALNLLLTPHKNKKYFLSDPANSIQKKCDRVLLLGHTGFKSARALNKWKLINLGTFGKVKLGSHLTLFHLITDGLMIGSTSFGIWDTFLKLKEFSGNEKEADKKIDKWGNRLLSLAQVMIGDQAEIEKYRLRCENKIEEVKCLIETKHRELKLHQDVSLEKKPRVDLQNVQNVEDESSDIQLEIQRLEKKLNKNQARLQKIVAHEYHSFVKELANKDVLGKVEKIVSEKNKWNYQNRVNLVKIASSVMKIFVITIALVMTAINLWSTIPYITLLSLGFISDTLGLAKIYIEKGPNWL